MMSQYSVGVLSDTHGLVRPEALRALVGSEQILHAGDVGGAQVLQVLEALAPVTAVRGNVDRGAWAQRLPEKQAVMIHGVWLYLLHDLHTLDLDPLSARISVVISGHSHRAAITEREGVLYLNPGSAGPKRFGLPASLARLHLDHGKVRAELIPL